MKILMYGVEGWWMVMLLMMDMVMKSECCLLDLKRSLLVLLHKDGFLDKVGDYRGVVVW